MEHVRIEDCPNTVQPAAVMRRLTEPLGCAEMAINYYELAPGDSFAFAYHAHEVQEELFCVLSGTATWETTDGTVTVEAGDVVRFEPGEFQRGWNRGEERVCAIALGAPLAYGDQPKYAHCPACETERSVTIERVTDTTVRTQCDDCGATVGRWTRGPDGENERVAPDAENKQVTPDD